MTARAGRGGWDGSAPAPRRASRTVLDSVDSEGHSALVPPGALHHRVTAALSNWQLDDAEELLADVGADSSPYAAPTPRDGGSDRPAELGRAWADTLRAELLAWDARMEAASAAATRYIALRLALVRRLGEASGLSALAGHPWLSPAPGVAARLMARSTVSRGMLATSAAFTAARRRGLWSGSAMPWRADTVISRMSLPKARAFLAFCALFRCMMFLACEWPAMKPGPCS